MTDLKAQRLENDINEIKGAIKDISRRLDSLERYSELIYKDRELINESREDMAGLKQRVVDNAQHVENVVKKGQFETQKAIAESADSMEQKVDEVKNDVVKGITGELTKGKGIIKKILKK